MKPIDFPERTSLIAEHQDEYVTLLMFNNPKTSKVNPTTPSFFTVNKKDLFR